MLTKPSLLPPNKISEQTPWWWGSASPRTPGSGCYTTLCRRSNIARSVVRRLFLVVSNGPERPFTRSRFLPRDFAFPVHLTALPSIIRRFHITHSFTSIIRRTSMIRRFHITHSFTSIIRRASILRRFHITHSFTSIITICKMRLIWFQISWSVTRKRIPESLSNSGLPIARLSYLRLLGITLPTSC